jgi:heterotetrameric sarcosine oxidase delta subunit
MQQIPCPWCGPRDDWEFHYGAEAHVARPETPSEMSDEDWMGYLYLRSNTKGPFRERWMHAAGCRRWFNVIRNTVSHEILGVYKVGETPPPLPGEVPAELSAELSAEPVKTEG